MKLKRISPDWITYQLRKHTSVELQTGLGEADHKLAIGVHKLAIGVSIFKRLIVAIYVNKDSTIQVRRPEGIFKLK